MLGKASVTEKYVRTRWREEEDEDEDGGGLCHSGIECERHGFLIMLSVILASLPSDSVIQLICVAKGTGLGLVIKGGANRAEGPMVFIQEIVPGGDCQKVGPLAQLMSH